MTVPVEPQFHTPTTAQRGVQRWQWAESVRVLSSAPVGGGLHEAEWLLNVGVDLGYTRTDLAIHMNEVASSLGLGGSGVGLLTAADVTRLRRGFDDGVTSDATVGISKPTWAADAEGVYAEWAPGTINIVVQVPARLSEAAAVNAVITATEAKTQALLERGIPGTGTASDAVAIVWPVGPSEVAFCGPRSEWGARVARATHAAVVAGIDAFG